MQLPTYLLSVIPIVSALVLGVKSTSPEAGSLLANSTRSLAKRSSDNVKLVCYYSNWAVYRPGLAKFTPQNINPFLCTHLIYAFAGLSSKFEMKAFDPYNDINQGNYKKFVGLKKYNNQLKTMIAIGGWNEGSKRFSKLVATPELRFTFIKSAMKFLREHNFDGIDFDWEYPAFREGSSAEDKEGYAKLIREIRYAFNNEKLTAARERLLVSVAVPAGQDYIDQGFDVPTISEFADFLNVLSYDYHTSFDPETDHHAPLKVKPGALDFEAAKLNVEWTINYFIKLGAQREKLILGIPTYGRSFTLADPTNNGVNALAEGPGEPGPSTREKGYLAFYEICQKVEDEDWQLHRPSPHVEGPFAVKDKQWVAFDDIEIIQDKARFIIDNGLGGAMVWTLDNDDFRGTCYGEQNPLVSSLRSALISTGPLVQSSPSEQSSSRVARPRTSTSEHSEAGLNALNVNTRRNQRRRQFYSTSTTTTTTTTTPAPTTAREALAFTTPEPPTTPDPGVEFTCEDEGFFNNPKDCRKYFWCLDSGPANLGIVAHSFTCPSGLFFSSKTEACDYAENVSCKVKKDSTSSTRKPKIKSRPKIATTTATQAPTTPMPPTTTTTQLPITGPPENKEKALVETMKKFNDAQKSGNMDELAQLANLIKSLGGIEKVQSLLKGERNSRTGSSENGLSSQSATTLSFFAPSYVTPKRQMESVTQAPAAVTESPVAKETERSNKPVRQRRPQFDYDSTPTTQATTSALFSYYEKPKMSASPAPQVSNSVASERSQSGNGREESEFVRKSNMKAFEFSYNMPDGRNSLMGAFNDMNARRISHDATPYPNATLHSAPPESSASPRQMYRVPVRVTGGNLVKVPTEVIENNLNVRRGPQTPRRIRVQSGFAVTSGAKPGVTYEDEFVLPKRPTLVQPEQFLPSNYESPNRDSDSNGISLPTSSLAHQFGPPSYQFENNKLETSKPSNKATQRRRPQNHFNQPYEESPINLLINTPPRSSQDTRMELPRESEPVVSSGMPTTAAPTTEYSPQTVKFTNYNTLPPEFDISPFTSSDFHNSVNANNYQKASSAARVESTTPLPSVEPKAALPGGRRRIARPRRPIPQPSQPVSVATSPFTTTSTTRRPQKVEYTEPVAENFNGPAVFASKEGNLGCSKRGVFAHPESCGMFVVCAPAGRGKPGMRTLTHHCPADQVFVQDVGRCRPGNKDRCQVF